MTNCDKAYFSGISINVTVIRLGGSKHRFRARGYVWFGHERIHAVSSQV